MPITASSFPSSLPITAGQLNQNMYTYDGSYFAAQGVLFHAHRPICHEARVQATVLGTTVNGGVNTLNVNGPNAALSLVDTNALFGIGCDSPGNTAAYQSSGVQCPGSSGIPGLRGGWVMMSHFVTCGTFSASPSVAGAIWAQGSQITGGVGTFQKGNTAGGTTPFAIEMFDVTNATQYYYPTVFLADANAHSNTLFANTTPGSDGNTPRFSQIWMSVDQGNGSTVPSIPTVQSTFGSTTAITSAMMNTSVTNALNLLSYPPIMEVEQLLNTSMPASTVTKVPFVSKIVDTYNGWGTAASTYIVPMSGMYFCHANLIFGIGSTSGNYQAGFTINGTNHYGGAYPPASTNGKIQTGVAVTRLLDLNAGDTLSTFGYSTQTGGTDLSNVYGSHMLMNWMCPQGPGTTLTWTDPDVCGVYWKVGTNGTALTNLLNSKISNDINFLLNRPYLIAYQTTAQTGLTQNTFSTITMNTVAGPIHNAQGDNYNGWSSSNHWYVAPVAGWYMVTAEISIAPVSSGTFIAGIACPTSGGLTAPTSPDYYQALVPSTTGNPSAATAHGIYYLNAGEKIYPQARYNGSSTWATSVTNFNSSFSVVWLSE